MSLNFNEVRDRAYGALGRRDLSVCAGLVFYLGVFTVAATMLAFYAVNPAYFERSVPTISRAGSYPPVSYFFATGMVLVAFCIFVTWSLARRAHKDWIDRVIEDPALAARAHRLNEIAAFSGSFAGFCLGSMGVISLEISNFMHMALSWGFFVSQILSFMIDTRLSLMLRRESRSRPGPDYDPNGRQWVCLIVCVFGLMFLFMFYAKDDHVFADRMFAQWIFVIGEYTVAFFSFYYSLRFQPLARQFFRQRVTAPEFSAPPQGAAQLATVPVRSRQ